MQLKTLIDKIKKLDRTWLILLGVILATIPCYCLGFFLLWGADRWQFGVTPTPSETATSTPGETIAPIFTVIGITETSTPTPTLTFTMTITYVLPPTNTPTSTETPSPTATQTLTPSPTNTLTPSPSATNTVDADSSSSSES